MLDCALDFCFVQRSKNLAVTAQALSHARSIAARDKRRRKLKAQIVEVVALFFSRLNDVTKAFRGQQPGSRSFLLDNSVNNKCGSVDNRLNVFTARSQAVQS